MYREPFFSFTKYGYLLETYISRWVIPERQPRRSSKSAQNVGAVCTPTDLYAFCYSWFSVVDLNSKYLTLKSQHNTRKIPNLWILLVQSKIHICRCNFAVNRTLTFHVWWHFNLFTTLSRDFLFQLMMIHRQYPLLHSLLLLCLRGISQSLVIISYSPFTAGIHLHNYVIL